MFALTVESMIALACGLLIGMMLAIPVGPIALLCMRRTLERGMVFGFITGLGAAFADGVYGAVAAFGIAAISGFLVHHNHQVRFVGGCFMLLLAVRLIMKRGLMKAKTPPTSGHKIGAFLSGFFLTATNPMTMFGFAAVFTSFGFRGLLKDPDLAAFLVLGIGLGSAIWWLVLTLGVVRLKPLISENILHRINLLAGGVLAGFGVYAIVTAMTATLHP